MRMNLEQWVRNGWLRRHEPRQDEIADLLSLVDRDLDDCHAAGLSPDWRLSIAYNAALQAATAALAASGYRLRRGEPHHYRTIQSLIHTVEVERRLVGALDGFRKKRNVMEYERAGVVSKTEADEMVELAKELKASVEQWLRDRHPELL
jgi:hypothetical protein